MTDAGPVRLGPPWWPGRRDWLAAGGLAAATLAVQLGVYVLGRRAATPTAAVMATLAACVAWIVLAAPAASASAQSVWGGLVRGGAVVDASAVTLIVLSVSARSEQGAVLVSLSAAARIYVVLLAVGLAGIALARLPGSPGGRMAGALAASGVLSALLASPLWVNGLLHGVPAERAPAVAAAAVRWNSYYSTTAAVADCTGFTWHTATRMYRITGLGSYVTPPAPAWSDSVWRLGAVAAAATGMAGLRRLARRRRQGT